MTPSEHNEPVETDRLIEVLAREGELLAETAERVGLAAPLPSCPGWEVRDLLAHLGFVHRWATGIVADQRVEPPGHVSEAAVLADGPPAHDLLPWFIQGHGSLVAALSGAPEDALRCWTFLPAPSPRAFWSRRQAHETAVHRADVELAGGAVHPFAADVAADGIDELVMGFAPTGRSKARVPEPRTLLVRATDTGDSWRVHFGSEGVVTERGQGGADAQVTAPASDLYLILWNRPPASPPEVLGQADLVDLWHTNLRVRW